MTLPNSQFEGLRSQGLWPTREGLHIGGADTPLKRLTLEVLTFDAGSVAANVSEQEAATTTAGFTSDDLIIAKPQTFTASIASLGAIVSADNTLQMEEGNFTASAIDRGSASWFIAGLRLQ